MGRLARVALLLLAACASLASADIGRHVHYEIRSSDHANILWHFEFASGGFLSFNVSLEGTPAPNTSLELLLATDTQLEPLVNNGPSFSDMCMNSSRWPMAWRAKLGPDEDQGMAANFSLIIPERSFYRILQLNCDEEDFELVLSYFAVNPGGEFLSLADVPYKTLYFVTPIWWAALTVFWLLNWVRYRNFNVRLQRVMTLVPFFECVLALCLHFYWDHLSRQGTESAQLALAVLLVRAVGDFIFFLCLMLAAHGWAITLDGLDWRQWRNVLALSVLLSVSVSLFSYFATVALFLLLLTAVVVVRYNVTRIVVNLSAMSQQAQILRRARIDPDLTPLAPKIVLFQRLQKGLVVYCSVYVIFNLWATIFLRDTPWLMDMIDDAMRSLLCLWLGTTYRMVPFNPFFFRVGSVEINREAAQGGWRVPLIAGGPASVDNPGLQWEPGMPLPQKSDPALARYGELRVLLVESPDGGDIAVASPLFLLNGVPVPALLQPGGPMGTESVAVELARASHSRRTRGNRGFDYESLEMMEDD